MELTYLKIYRRDAETQRQYGSNDYYSASRRICSGSIFLPLLMACVAGLWLACTAPPRQLGEVRLALGYVPNIQFAPYYVAVADEHFQAAGLQVRLEYVSEADILKMVANGRYEFAATDGDSVILARIQGLSVRYVFTQYSEYPVGLISQRRLEVRRLADLKGKRIGIPEFFGSTFIGLKAMMYAAGVTESDFDIEAIGYTQTSMLSEGKCDAVMGYLANEPIMLEARGVPVDVLAVSDVSHLVGPGLVTSEAVLAGHNNLARNVVAALRRGLKKTIDDPDHAFQAALKFMPDLQGAENLRLQRMVLRRAIELWKSSGELGRCDEERWRQSQEVLYRAKMISKKLPPAEFFTNELIDAALRLP